MENKKDTTNKIFRHLLDFVYDELLNQFINNNGECEDSTLWMVNLLDIKNDGNC
jgi:hypothetical protein